MLKLGIIGAGNIVRNRHLPALKKRSDWFDLIGIADTNGDRVQACAKTYSIQRIDTLDGDKDIKKIAWINDCQALLIAVPPTEHYRMVKQALNLGKHVLVEKPFVVDLKHGEELLQLAYKNHVFLALNHNFQFSGSFSKLDNLVKSGELGRVKSLYAYQISNDSRRLPVWADTLPFGLFYDESPHLLYLIKRYGMGNIEVINSTVFKSARKENTPQIITVNMRVNKIPTVMHLNFEGPVCEWFFSVIGERKIATVDLFRDILLVLPNDGQHLTKEVFRTSGLATLQHWGGVIRNGFEYLRGNLFYGTQVIHEHFYRAVMENNPDYLKNMSGSDGLTINKLQHEIMSKSQIIQ